MSCWPWLGQRLGQPATATTIDTDLVSVIMLLEMAIVYGFAVPMIPVLCLCAVLTHLAVFHVSRVHLQARFTHDAKPVSDYLVFSFVLSNTLNIAYFWTNAERRSAIFVTVSCMGLMVGYFAALVTKALRTRNARKTEPRESLLAPEDQLTTPPGRAVTSIVAVQGLNTAAQAAPVAALKEVPAAPEAAPEAALETAPGAGGMMRAPEPSSIVALDVPSGTPSAEPLEAAPVAVPTATSSTAPEETVAVARLAIAAFPASPVVSPASAAAPVPALAAVTATAPTAAPKAASAAALQATSVAAQEVAFSTAPRAAPAHQVYISIAEGMFISASPMACLYRRR